MGATVASVLAAMSSVYQVVIGMFANVIDTIVGNPLLFVPVLLSLLGALVLYAIGVIRKLGVRGISSGGKRRGRR